MPYRFLFRSPWVSPIDKIVNSRDHRGDSGDLLIGDHAEGTDRWCGFQFVSRLANFRSHDKLMAVRSSPLRRSTGEQFMFPPSNLNKVLGKKSHP